jgi:hypothetical protein
VALLTCILSSVLRIAHHVWPRCGIAARAG